MRSLFEHLAAAPLNVRSTAELLAKLAGAGRAAREQALAHLPADVAETVREALPPPGLDGPELVAHQEVLIAEVLGVEHGGTEWLRAMRGKLFDTNRGGQP